MRLYAAIDLHSNNNVLVIIDERDRIICERRLTNELRVVLAELAPHRKKIDRLPCGQLMANAAYLQVCLIAYNLVQTFKRCALPQSWRKFEIKNLRFRLLGRAAKLVSHAGQTILKLSQGYAHFDVFEQARWAVLNPAIASAWG